MLTRKRKNKPDDAVDADNKLPARRRQCRISIALRLLQRDSGCSRRTLGLILHHLEPFLPPLDMRKLHRSLVVNNTTAGAEPAGARKIEMVLNGCIGCHEHVFKPQDKSKQCPRCAHARFDEKGKPHERCSYFPLRQQLKQMLSLPGYRQLLMHEVLRPRNANLMTDVYDSPRWRSKMGPPSRTVSRIAIQICVDGAPAHKRMEIETVTPLQACILSLPPWLRYKARHMLVQMILPSKCKGQFAKKYYDWAAAFEMNDLHINGVSGIRVIVFGVSLDTPGRRELLNMQSCTSFYPCPHCLHTWQPGLRRPVHGGYRRFLQPTCPWRQKSFVFQGCTYYFRDIETRSVPMARNDGNVKVMSSIAERDRRPFCGHKGKHLLERWVGMDWDGQFVEVMHDTKCFCDMILKGLVGKGVARTGFGSTWNDKDARHYDDCRAFTMFPEWTEGTLPPWRLTKNAIHTMNSRVCSMWWPHYCDVLCKNKAGSNQSFWTQTDLMWKCKHKWYILLTILPTCLRGHVPAVHKAVMMIVSALRNLHGQIVCVEEARRLRVLSGSSVLEKTRISKYGENLVKGLVMLEGSFPVAHLNPAMHHLVHIGMQTAKSGKLEDLAMWCFERNNKRIKGFVKHGARPLVSAARNIETDIATRYHSYLSRPCDEFEEKAPSCRLCVRSTDYTLSTRERVDVSFYGITTFDQVRSFTSATILGVHFKANEWGQRRCGSVITTVCDNTSWYLVVKNFLRVGGKSFARVEWLSKPIYPYPPFKIVVKVRRLSRNEQRRRSTVLPIEKIDPCTVAVMPDEDGVHFYMLREKGTNRTN